MTSSSKKGQPSGPKTFVEKVWAHDVTKVFEGKKRDENSPAPEYTATAVHFGKSEGCKKCKNEQEDEKKDIKMKSYKAGSSHLSSWAWTRAVLLVVIMGLAVLAASYYK